ncbi:MAG: NAD(P)-dependent oxidoreductase [Alphaproteobacteria bacterium]|nr:NAD(P)-dependent oxidoreductase [Alphaproteobacteria bacterium]
MPDAKVLVTGAAGLIGRHVVNALTQRGGVEIHAATRSLAHETKNGDIRWHKVDLLDHRQRIQLLDSAEPQTIIHCAWVTDHGAYWTAPENLDWASATIALAREGHERGAKRFVGVGTCAEYAWGGAEPLSEETTPLEPKTLYGVSKDATRRVLESYSQTSDLSFAWARVAMLYGAGEFENRFVASLARALVRGEPAKMSSGKLTRDFLDARDVGAAIAAVAMSPVKGAINIGSGQPTTLLQVGETLAQLAGHPDLLKPGALSDRPNEPASLVMDVARLTGEANFRPRITLEQGLADALAHWRAEARV